MCSMAPAEASGNIAQYLGREYRAGRMIFAHGERLFAQRRSAVSLGRGSSEASPRRLVTSWTKLLDMKGSAKHLAKHGVTFALLAKGRYLWA